MAQSDVEAAVTRIAEETSLWQEFLLAHRILVERMAADMAGRHHLPLSWFDVLIHLAQAPERTLRQADLRDRILLSESGLSRLLGRMESAELVERSTASSDRRGVSLSLTSKGEASLVAATADHVDLVDELFTSTLRPADHKVLQRVLRKITEQADTRS